MTVTNKYTKCWDQGTNSCWDFVSSPTSNQQWYLVEQHDNCNPVGNLHWQAQRSPQRSHISRLQLATQGDRCMQLPCQHQQGHPNDHDEEGGYEADDPLVRRSSHRSAVPSDSVLKTSASPRPHPGGRPGLVHTAPPSPPHSTRCPVDGAVEL